MFGDAGTSAPWDGGVIAALYNTLLPTCVIVPNYVTLAQTVWA